MNEAITIENLLFKTWCEKCLSPQALHTLVGAPFPDCEAQLLGAGDFRASLHSPQGGSLTLLWHQKVGAILAATANEYFPVDPLPIQPLVNGMPIRRMTPCISVGRYRNIYDTAFIFTADEENKTYSVSGRLKSLAGRPLSDGAGEEAGYHLTYRFTPGAVFLTAESTHIDGDFSVPVISSAADKVLYTAKGFKIARPGGRVVIESDGVLEATEGIARRYFNPTGGSDHLMLRAALPAGKPVEVRISVKS